MTDGSEQTSPGWDAIEHTLESIYGNQEPFHFGTIVPYSLGGPDPLEGTSVYAANLPSPHWHYVTYGFSELHQKECENPEVSGFGFELTFRLLKGAEGEPPQWALEFLQNIARYVFESGNALKCGHYIDLNGPIALECETAIRAIVLAEDSEMETITTPYGSVSFLQIVGIALDELESIKAWSASSFLDLFREFSPRLITDLNRASMLDQESFRSQVIGGTLREGSSTQSLHIQSLRWVIKQLPSGNSTLEVTMGAIGVRDFKSVLPARIPFSRPLIIVSQNRLVEIEEADKFSWAEEQDGELQILILRIPSEASLHLADAIAIEAGEYTVNSLPNFCFRVEPSIITGPDEAIANVIG